ncbi:cupin domain-containing protein [Modicisalibacter sp. 'Wilcox']|uniref:cupin domain-containing protein n=1 Tax=Modicisalibacter sp. 'Wilcox' TaxID=2679914 RepID=UPI00079467A8|nr:cupin domain-containing protein [Modicisalibacter sp. 'Wilcox']KXS38970.1 MAG: double-stranded beta helix domain-containing protein [Halomonadaceae bacterium T82-2]
MDDTLGALGLEIPDCLHFADDGAIPNSRLATLVFRAHRVPRSEGGDRERLAARFGARFAASGWPASWRGEVFDYHHYHSTAHEAFGVLSGWGLLRLGGEAGRDVEVRRGDVLVLPAGTGHCQRDASEDFLLLAAYPEDQPTLDLIGADPARHDAAVARIAEVSQPARDPLGGEMARWWPAPE